MQKPPPTPRKRAGRWFLVPLALVIFSLVYWVWPRKLPPEATYEGRTVTQWLYNSFEHGLDSTERLAFQFMGSNAVPTLRHILRSSSKLERIAVDKLPKKWKSRLANRSLQGFNRKVRALSAVDHLGPEARSATPELLQILADKTEHFSTRLRAMGALHRIDPDPLIMLPALIRLTNDPDTRIAQFALDYPVNLKKSKAKEADDRLWKRILNSNTNRAEVDIKAEPLWKTEATGLSLKPSK